MLNWRENLAAGLHHSGLLRLTERLARRYEVATPAGGARRLRRSSRRKYGILCYHRIGVGGVPVYSEMKAPVFEAHIRHLKNNYRLVSLDQLMRELANGESHDPTVAITFDDGYAGLYSDAFPVLKKFAVPAMVYLVTDAITTQQAPWYDRIFLAFCTAAKPAIHAGGQDYRVGGSQWERIDAAAELILHLRHLPDEVRVERCKEVESQVRLPEEQLRNRMLTWEHVREMQRGGVAFGSHTVTHRVLAGLPAEERQREFTASKAVLESALQTEVAHFAYPFGKPFDFGAFAEADLRRAGYRSAVTTLFGINEPGCNPLMLSRVSVDQRASLSLLAFQLNRCFLEAAAATPAATAQSWGEEQSHA